MKPLRISIDKCNNCFLCLTQCSRDKIKKIDGKVFIDDESNDCIECGHCYAICPSEAILTSSKEKLIPNIKTSVDEKNLNAFLKGRRSQRNYSDKKVDKETILKLIDLARFAPTGTNSQATAYTVIDDAEKIQKISDEVIRVFKRFYSILKFRPIRSFLKIFVKQLRDEKIFWDLKRLIQRHENNEDPIFYHAPLVIFVSANKNIASTPYDDCAYALYHLVLGAETLGLGSCINGLSTAAVKLNKKLRKLLEIKSPSKIYTCAGFGYPTNKYPFQAQRKKANIKFL